MYDTWTIRVSLFLAGVVPFALAGGLSDDTTVWPWAAGVPDAGRLRVRFHRAATGMVDEA